MPTEVRPTPIAGVLELVGQPFRDHRGAFLNAFRAQEPAFAQAWGDRAIAQVNLSRTEAVGAVRGLHLQAPPHSEAKLVRCMRGRVWDVAVDVRAGSPTFLRWHAERLSADNLRALLIPEGFAHGFQAITDDVELLYCHSAAYAPDNEAALNPFDPRLGIAWPLPVTEVSPRDLNRPMLSMDFEGVIP